MSLFAVLSVLVCRSLHVLEWCEDDYHSTYEGAPADGSAWVEVDRTETRRLLRGSWGIDPRDCRSAVRGSAPRDFRYFYFGFRVCCVPPRSLLSPSVSPKAIKF